MEQQKESLWKTDTTRLFLQKYSRAFTVIPEKLENIRSKLLFPSGKKSSEKKGIEEPKSSKDFNTHFAYLQNWFIHISHQDRIRFIVKLVRVFLKDNEADLLLEFFGITLLTKDIFYGRTQYTHTIYDRTPIDGSRSKSLGALSLEADNNSFLWFTSLKRMDQVIVIIILTRLGGTSILYAAVREIIINNVEKKKSTKVKRTKDSTHPANKKIIVEEAEDIGLNSGKSENASLIKDEHRDSLKIKKETEWEEMYSQMLREAGVVAQGEKETENKSEPTDMLQLLPMSVNRLIYSKLDYKSKANLRNLNSYWKAMSNDIQKEESTRNWLNKLIKKYKITTMAFKGRSWNNVNTKKYSGETKKSLSLESIRNTSKTTETPLFRTRETSNKFGNLESTYNNTRITKGKSLPDLKLTNFELKTRSGFEIKFKKTPFLKSPYTGKYTVVNIYERYDHERVMAANKQWIAISDGYHIDLLSTLTGAPSPARLEGHTGGVTSLVFHPTCSRIFSGSYDSNVRYWEIYSRSLIREYSGHTSIITSISVNEVFVCSASMDKTIKVFDMDNGSIMWNFECITTPTVIAVDKKQTLFAGSFVGHVEKILLTYDEDYKKVQHCPSHKVSETLKDDGDDLDKNIDNVSRRSIKSEVSIRSRSSRFDTKSAKSETFEEENEDKSNSSFRSNGRIRFAHSGEITAIFVENPFIFTAGVDGNVHVWHQLYFDGGPVMTLQHRGRRVNAVFVSYCSIFTASEDGRLRIWDVETKSLKREIIVNTSGRPIVGMVCLQVFDHSKIVINNEDGIKILIFPLEWTKNKRVGSEKKKKSPPQQITRILTTQPGNVLNKALFRVLPKGKSNSEIRGDALDIRLESLPEIQATTSKHVIYDNIPTVLQAMKETPSMLRYSRHLAPTGNSSIANFVGIQKFNQKNNSCNNEGEQVIASKKDILIYVNPFKKVL